MLHEVTRGSSDVSVGTTQLQKLVGRGGCVVLPPWMDSVLLVSGRHHFVAQVVCSLIVEVLLRHSGEWVPSQRPNLDLSNVAHLQL